MSWAEAKWVVDSLLQKVGQPPNNMRVFKAFSISKSSLGLQFLEPTDSYAGENIICAVEGVMIRMSTTGYPTSISDGTLVIDNKDLGEYDANPYVIEGLVEGQEYFFSAFPYSHQGVYNQYNNESNRTSCVVGANVYGVKRDITSSYPTWSRTDLAIGKTATASVGAVAGESDFDDIMPWAGIKRETLDTGDVMVKIPKFYYQRYREGNIEYIKIADGYRTGFKLHPLFNHGGVESECAYVAAYLTSSNNKSETSKGYDNLKNINTMRTNAQSKGTGWSIMDMSALSAIQMLFLVEFATYDSQGAIGKGYCNADTRLMSGTCDAVPNLTGRTGGTDGETNIVWRGIETLWGNVWEYVDGAMRTNGSYYVCNNIPDYSTSTVVNYSVLSYKIDTNESMRFITELGIEEGEYDYVMLPVAAGNGSASTYICDAILTKSSGIIFEFGGGYTEDLTSGLFCIRSNAVYADTSANIRESGSRLMYIPQ